MLHPTHGHARRAMAAAVALIALGAASLAVAQTTVTIAGSEYYLYNQMELTRAPGEVAFDPTNSDCPYLAFDPDSGTGAGAIYRGGVVGDVLVFAPFELVVQGGTTNEAFESPSGIAFDPNGDLYVVEDYDGFLAKVVTPRTGPPFSTSVIVGKQLFGTANTDDDPIAITAVPAGFGGSLVSAGDMVFPDRGYNNNNSQNAIYAYTPGEAVGEFFNRLFATNDQLKGIVGTADLNDITFSTDGTTLFGITSTGKVIKVDNTGTTTQLAITGATFTLLQALGTNPADGRLWIADDTSDQVWSVDPATGEARLELTFARAGATAPDVVQFHFPGLQFSSTGEYFTVADIGPAPYTLFVFKRRPAGTNVPPTARIAVSPAERVLGSGDEPIVFTLDGTASDDGDGGTQGLTYNWVYLGSTPGVTIGQPTSPITTVTLPNSTYPGAQHSIALIVSDGQAKAEADAVLGVSARPNLILPIGRYFKSGRSVFWSGTPGDVAFDPVTSDIYIAKDQAPSAGGGIYRLIQNLDGSYAIGELVAGMDQPCSLAVAPDGVLWWARDYTGNVDMPYFGKVEGLRTPPSYTTTGIVTNFGTTTGDDDPFVVKVVPPGFAGPLLAAGDILIADNGVDDNAPIAIYTYRPSAPVGDPAAYTTSFLPVSTAEGSVLKPYEGKDFVDMDFSPDGTKLYVLFTDGQMIEVNSAGQINRQIAPFGVTLANLEGMAVNPVDGRIWLVDDNIDQVWSFNPDDTELAVLEAEFDLPGEPLVDYNINFHDPSLTFSPDGQRLVITDTGRDSFLADGWIWILDVTPPPASFPDFNADECVDGTDLLEFANCVLGPRIPVTTPALCVTADFDKDGDVDQDDFAVMQRCFSGTGIVWSLSCKD